MKEKDYTLKVKSIENDPVLYIKKSVWLNMIKKRNDLAKHNIELSQQRDFWKKNFIDYPKLSKKEIKQLLYVIDFLTDETKVEFEYTLNIKLLTKTINKFEKILKK